MHKFHRGFASVAFILVIIVALVAGYLAVSKGEQMSDGTNIATSTSQVITGDSPQVVQQPQAPITPLSEMLTSVTPQVVEQGGLSARVSEQIVEHIANLLIAKGKFGQGDVVSLLAVGKRYVLYRTSRPVDCGGGSTEEILDAQTGLTTKVLKYTLFSTSKYVVFVGDKALYTYSPDSSVPVEIPGSRIGENEFFSGELGMCENYTYTKTDTSVTINVATRTGSDPDVSPVVATRKLTVSLQ